MMFLGFKSLSAPGRAAAAALAAAGFASGFLITGSLGLLSQGPATAAVSPAPAVPQSAVGDAAGSPAYPADVVRVVDGDTFEARVQVWPGIEITTKVRLRGVDAPELRASCAEERVRAQAARDALAALLAQGRVAVSAVRLDKYGGRVVADASAGGTASVAQALLAGGHVRRYGGGRRAGWCDGRAF